MTDIRSGAGMRSRNNAARPRQKVASKELQEARRRKRQREVMRNRIIFGTGLAVVAALIILLVVKLVGFVLNAGGSSDTSTLTFKEDGQVVFEEITEFDTDTYSKAELKSYTKDLIASFNETYGDEAITLNKLSVRGDKAYIKTTYKDAECYSSFTSYDTANSTYEQAIEAGYDFNTLFSSVNDGTLGEPQLVNADTTFAGANVAIVNENVTVKVPGTITYVSNASTELSGEDTVTISQADDNEDATDLVFIIYTLQK